MRTGDLAELAGTEAVVEVLLNSVWLKVLNDSKRSSKCARSVIANDL